MLTISIEFLPIKHGIESAWDVGIVNLGPKAQLMYDVGEVRVVRLLRRRVCGHVEVPCNDHSQDS